MTAIAPHCNAVLQGLSGGPPGTPSQGEARADLGDSSQLSDGRSEHSMYYSRVL